MWPFDLKYRKAFKQTQERDKLYKGILDAAAAGDPAAAGSWLCTLVNNDKYMNDPLTQPVLMTLISLREKGGPEEALGAALYLMNGGGRKAGDRRQATLEAISDKAFDLIAKLDKADAGQMATAAMVSGVMTLVGGPGSPREARALKSWEQAMDVLIAKDVGNYALGAACNATISLGTPALAALALKKYEDALTDLAATDRPKAAELAQSFARKCAEFEDRQQVPFVARSKALVKRLG